MIATVAQATEWTVRKVFGEVWIQSGLIQQVALAEGKRVFDEATIITGENGRTILTRGTEVVTIGKNSRVTLPPTDTSGRTKILHRSGTAIYNVRKKPARHFSVDTPNIVAVVKGTKFEIDESRDSSVVSVYSGIVEVTSRVDGRTVRVEPGQTAILEGGRTWLIPVETQDGSADRNVSVPAKGASSEKSDNGNRYAHGHDRNGKSGSNSNDGKENEKGNGGGKKN